MDSSSANRYDLLCTLDDDASDPLETLVRKKAKQQKQQQKIVTTNPSSVNAGTVGGLAEKENKSSAMNKNVEKKFGYGATTLAAAATTTNAAAAAAAAAATVTNNSSLTTIGPKQQRPGNLMTTNQTGAGNVKESSHFRNGDQRTQREGKTLDRNVNFKTNNNNSSSSETREQRNNRRNRDDRQYQQQTQQQNGNIAGDYHQNSERPQRQQRGGAGGNNRDGGPGNARDGGGGGGGGGGPQRRSFDSQNRGGKREFDRQSGSDKTGVKAVDKRDGGGAHNWGSHKQDLDDLNKTTEEVGTDKDDSAGEQQTEQTTNIEEETKEITLDEWKAQRAVRAKPQFNIRKAGEGEDLSQWKKMVALNNKKRDDESEEELEYDPSMYPQRVGRLQRVLDIEFHFNDGRRVGGIGGRGRGRARGQPGGGNSAGGVGGGGGRRPPRNPDQMKTESGGGGGGSAAAGGGGGGGITGGITGERGDRHHRGMHGGQHAPKVDDEHDFPSLG